MLKQGNLAQPTEYEILQVHDRFQLFSQVFSWQKVKKQVICKGRGQNQHIMGSDLKQMKIYLVPQRLMELCKPTKSAGLATHASVYV